MTEAAELKPAHKVLEVGTGSGYAAAVASRLARTVHTIERHGHLAKVAADRLSALGYTNCIVHTADGTRGLPDEAPFDAILVAAGGPTLPEPLKKQLAIGGRLVMTVARRRHMSDSSSRTPTESI
ncbi:protein-L-isoaspartate(D-aspartate) O-methyltransferase [Bradyrhizobium canariense]|nr:protein-L-isoaspartate(D-aspartate) O-methyltransferase [Bradyrhizobium canariense]